MDAFTNFTQGPGWLTYQNFIIPQLINLITTLLTRRVHLSVLEIGPGHKTVISHLPSHLRRAITRYVAFEPNSLFATRLEAHLTHPTEIETAPPFPALKTQPKIHHTPFTLSTALAEKFDLILFCHSLYGLTPKRTLLEHALSLTAQHPAPGVVVIFHRDGELSLNGLACSHIARFPCGVVAVDDDDEKLDLFLSFIAGFVPRDELTRLEWRRTCRAMGSCGEGGVLFAAPEVVAVVTGQVGGVGS